VGGRLDRLLDSLAEQTVAHETIVIDNASPGGSVSATGGRYDFAEVVRLDHNAGFSMPMNIGARRASTETLVLLNDDCVCDPEFIERLIEPLDPGAGVVMASGVLRDWRHPELIDSAGMELDRTLLVYDYLNGVEYDSCPLYQIGQFSPQGAVEPVAGRDVGDGVVDEAVVVSGSGATACCAP